MRKMLVAIGCALSLGVGVNRADAVTILNIGSGDPFYIGALGPDTPANPANESIYIDALLTLSAGAGNTMIGSQTYSRLGSTRSGPFPAATAAGAIQTDVSGNLIIVPNMGFAYILAKYATIAFVWEVNGVSDTSFQLPATAGQFGISHYALFDPTNGVPDPNDVPDGGTTIGLLGFALLGIGFLRRHFA